MQKLLAGIASLTALLAAWGVVRSKTTPPPAPVAFVADSVCTGGRVFQIRASDTASAELVGDTIFVVPSDSNADYRDTIPHFQVDVGKSFQIVAFCMAPTVRMRQVPILPKPRTSTPAMKVAQLAFANL
jgi:hypothetical protein